MRALLSSFAIVLAFAAPLQASLQVPPPDPDTPRPIAAHGSVWMEELTWMEVRDALRAGHTTAIIPTGGIEQNGPYLATGKHNIILRATAERIARKLGNALVTPVVGFVPEGGYTPPSGHMRYPGTISVSQETFKALVSDIAESLRTHGFEHVILIGDSGGNQEGLELVAQTLSKTWQGSGTSIHYIPEYYDNPLWREWLEDQGVREVDEGLHDDVRHSAIMLSVDPTSVRMEQRIERGLFSINGVDLAPVDRTLDLADRLIDYQAEVTVDAIERRIGVPAFEVDAAWPKPLPNNWILGQVAAVAVDSLAEAQEERLRQNRLISQLEQGQSVLGLNIENRSVESGRWLRASGLDFVLIDLEHQVYDFTAMRDFVLGLHEQPFSNEVIEHAAGSTPARNSPPFFPPPEPPTVLVKLAPRGQDAIAFDVRHSLKMGAMGVFVPFVESGAAVEAAIEAAKNAESIRYILRASRDVWREQNQPWPLFEHGEFLIGAMIESHEGEENIDEILSTPGLGMVWLAHVSSEAVERSILAKCLERGIFVASPHSDPADFAADVEIGYRIFFFGWDRDLFYRGLGDVLQRGRGAIGQR